MLAFRQWFRIDRAWVKRREVALVAQEQAAIQLARDDTSSPELRARRPSAQRADERA